MGLNHHWKYGFKVPIENVTELDLSMLADENLQDVQKFIAFALAGRIVKEYLIASSNAPTTSNFYVLSGFGKNIDSKNDKEKGFFRTINNFLEYFQLYSNWMAEMEQGTGRRLLNFDFCSKELCDIIKTHSFRKKKKGILFGKEIMEPTLTIKDIFGEMSSVYGRQHMQQGKAKFLNPNETMEYAFFHSLYVATLNVVKEKLDFKRN